MHLTKPSVQTVLGKAESVHVAAAAFAKTQEEGLHVHAEIQLLLSASCSSIRKPNIFAYLGCSKTQLFPVLNFSYIVWCLPNTSNS